MSWHYLPELAAEYSAGICLDGDVSVQSNTTSMQETFCSQDSKTDACQDSQFGTMCEPLMENHGEAWLTLYREAFRVKTSRQPEKEPELKEQEADYGKKWHELSVKYDRNTHSWKTHRCLFDEDLPQCLVTLPKWGMMQSGVLFRLRTAEHPTSDNDSGVWLGTPTAEMIVRSKRFRSGHPTPAEFVKFATPTVCGNYNRKGASSTSGDGLATQVGGRLNPTWVEWLMSWPLGWTDCDASVTAKFRSWQLQHGVDFLS